MARDDASMLKLGVSSDIPVGLNFGIVKHIPGNSFRRTFVKADELMNKDKTVMYKKLELDRRQ